jgi:beta-aspartyl-peptidase (threonine type)
MLSKPPASHPDIPRTRRGLGLTLLTRSRNPSRLARALYLSPSLAPHTFLSGSAADKLGETLGQDVVNPSYFFTEHRWREHRRGLGLPEEPLPGHTDPGQVPPLDQLPTGTVGAVALDVRGCIAAVTSTGGRTNKLVGRVGDTPSMGSGFWAEEWKRDSWRHKLWANLTGRHKARAVGVSGTGDGDVRLGSLSAAHQLMHLQYFIRQATAATIARRVRYLHEPLKKAAKQVVDDLFQDGGMGGVIALDNTGNGMCK